VPVQYCGGDDYQDVSLHNMVLQSDGYMECSILAIEFSAVDVQMITLIYHNIILF
jgi:hypothetical protein